MQIKRVSPPKKFSLSLSLSHTSKSILWIILFVHAKSFENLHNRTHSYTFFYLRVVLLIRIFILDFHIPICWKYWVLPFPHPVLYMSYQAPLITHFKEMKTLIILTDSLKRTCLSTLHLYSILGQDFTIEYILCYKWPICLHF